MDMGELLMWALLTVLLTERAVDSVESLGAVTVSPKVRPPSDVERPEAVKAVGLMAVAKSEVSPKTAPNSSSDVTAQAVLWPL